MHLHPRTTATLHALDQFEWFRCVGLHDTESALVLSSWQEAIEYCSSIEWENLTLEATNQLRERILERSTKALNRWNEIAAEVRAAVEPVVQRQIAGVVELNSLPQVFEDCVQWDIGHLCMEAEYAEVFPPAFFASQAYWYRAGHFPCGWVGDFPNGNLVVY